MSPFWYWFRFSGFSLFYAPGADALMHVALTELALTGLVALLGLVFPWKRVELCVRLLGIPGVTVLVATIAYALIWAHLHNQ